MYRDQQLHSSSILISFVRPVGVVRPSRTNSVDAGFIPSRGHTNSFLNDSIVVSLAPQTETEILQILSHPAPFFYLYASSTFLGTASRWDVRSDDFKSSTCLHPLSSLFTMTMHTSRSCVHRMEGFVTEPVS